MILIEEIQKKQKIFIKECIDLINDFIQSINVKKLEMIMIAGSVARGTFMPGQYDGAIDLIVFKKDETFNPEKELGKDIEKSIPGHFIKFKDKFFQIKIYDDSYLINFHENTESEKYAFFESKIIYKENDELENRIREIENREIKENIKNLFDKAYDYIKYLLSEYKIDRWKKRNAIHQLNMNLYHAVNQAIRCLFYINKKYYPVEDRALYFSFNLDKKPENLNEIYEKIMYSSENTMEDYEKKEKMFRMCLLDYISKHSLCIIVQ